MDLRKTKNYFEKKSKAKRNFTKFTLNEDIKDEMNVMVKTKYLPAQVKNLRAVKSNGFMITNQGEKKNNCTRNVSISNTEDIKNETKDKEEELTDMFKQIKVN